MVTEPRVKHELARAGNDWVERAPAIIVACAVPAQSAVKNDQPYYMLDVGIAMEHLVLAAADQGLGTCWVGWFDEATARRALRVPEEVRVVAFTPLGYPAETPEPRPRKSRGGVSSCQSVGIVEYRAFCRMAENAHRTVDCVRLARLQAFTLPGAG